MPTRFEAYRMRDGVTPLAEDYFNPVLGDIDTRLARLEDQRADLQRVIDDVSAFGLQRIDTLIGPSMSTLNEMLADARAQRDALLAAVGDADSLVRQPQLTAALADLQVAVSAALLEAIADATASPTSATYTYDSDGRISSVTETMPSGSRTTTYSYDISGRVTQSVVTEGGAATTTVYSYDVGGALIGYTVL